jgi:hypothetical protein
MGPARSLMTGPGKRAITWCRPCAPMRASSCTAFRLPWQTLSTSSSISESGGAGGKMAGRSAPCRSASGLATTLSGAALALVGAAVLVGAALATGVALRGAAVATLAGASSGRLEVSSARGRAVMVPDGGEALGAETSSELAGFATTAETAASGFAGGAATLIVTDGEMETLAAGGRAGIVTALAEPVPVVPTAAAADTGVLEPSCAGNEPTAWGIEGDPGGANARRGPAEAAGEDWGALVAAAERVAALAMSAERAASNTATCGAACALLAPDAAPGGTDGAAFVAGLAMGGRDDSVAAAGALGAGCFAGRGSFA